MNVEGAQTSRADRARWIGYLFRRGSIPSDRGSAYTLETCRTMSIRLRLIGDAVNVPVTACRRGTGCTWRAAVVAASAVKRSMKVRRSMGRASYPRPCRPDLGADTRLGSSLLHARRRGHRDRSAFVTAFVTGEPPEPLGPRTVNQFQPFRPYRASNRYACGLRSARLTASRRTMRATELRGNAPY